VVANKSGSAREGAGCLTNAIIPFAYFFHSFLFCNSNTRADCSARLNRNGAEGLDFDTRGRIKTNAPPSGQPCGWHVLLWANAQAKLDGHRPEQFDQAQCFGPQAKERPLATGRRLSSPLVVTVQVPLPPSALSASVF